MVGILGICFAFTKTCTKYVKVSEKIYDMTHEEIEDTLSNLISVYTAQKTADENKRINKFTTKLYKSQQVLENCNNKYRLLFSGVCILIFIVLNFYSLYLYKNKTIKLNSLISIIIIN